jgi:hypothetical protein
VLIVFAAFELLLIAVAVVGGMFLYVARVGAPTSSSRPNQLVWAAALAPLLVTFASSQFAYSSGLVPWVSPVAHWAWR